MIPPRTPHHTHLWMPMYLTLSLDVWISLQSSQGGSGVDVPPVHIFRTEATTINTIIVPILDNKAVIMTSEVKARHN